MTDIVNGLGDLRAAAGFLARLGPFLRGPLGPVEARARLARQMAAREETFGRILQRAVFDRPTSPYRRLFAWAGIGLDDVRILLSQVGVEGTLERLHDAGIYIALEEFKGKQPLQRPGLEIDVRAEDLDNPLSARQYESWTGGSGGTARPILIGLDLLEHESAYHARFYDKLAFAGPVAAWLPAPPGAMGLKSALIGAKLGRPLVRWFSQNRADSAPVKHRVFSHATISAAAVSGAHIPPPEYTPAGSAASVASFLAECCSNGSPALLLTTPSSAVRTCIAAKSQGLDVAGSVFLCTGEPYTAAKASVIGGAGCRGFSIYGMVEAGMIGIPCHEPRVPDDVHLVSDKIATIQRDRAIGESGTRVQALFHTTLLPAAPKVMLNVESGDYGILETRDCGCGALPATFRRHLHAIRSYEKLTSEGMHFLGGDLVTLLEQVLPERFGGYPTDYQLVEREVGALAKVSLVVSPSVGALDPDEVVAMSLEFLRGRGIGQRLMAEIWANGTTLDVVRAEPHVTSGAKIQALQKVIA